MAHTVLEFTHLDFDDHWSRAGAVLYTSMADATLTVVTESHTGVKATYFFKVPIREVVYVSVQENLVYIPARCAKKTEGDVTKCGE